MANNMADKKKGNASPTALNVISETCDSTSEDEVPNSLVATPASNSLTRCPKLKKKSPRLPREMWGTEAARERERALHRARQQKYRARRRAEVLREARGGHTSEEESEEELPVPLPATVVPDTANAGYSSSSEDQAKEHAQVQEKKPTACKMLVEDMPQPFCGSSASTADEDLDKLAELFAKVKCSSNVSDSAMNKLFSTFVNHNDKIMRLIGDKTIGPSYSKSVRPIVVSKLLPIYTSLYLMEKNPRGNKFHRIDGLKKIPKKYLQLPETKKWKLLRTEAHVKLKDVREQYILQHGDTEETRRNLLNTQLSVDGVSESRKGARTFIIVSMRIGSCLFLLHSFNPLVGVDESKPTARELLE